MRGLRWTIRTCVVLVRDRPIDLVDLPIRRSNVSPTKAFAVEEHLAGEHGSSPFQLLFRFQNITNPQAQDLLSTHLFRSLRGLHNLEHLPAGKSRTRIACEMHVHLGLPLFENLHAQHVTHKCNSGFEVGRTTQHPIETNDERCVGGIVQVRHTSHGTPEHGWVVCGTLPSTSVVVVAVAANPTRDETRDATSAHRLLRERSWDDP
jgi:hypothetical protein